MEDTNWRRKSLIELIIRFLSIICLKVMQKSVIGYLNFEIISLTTN